MTSNVNPRNVTVNLGEIGGSKTENYRRVLNTPDSSSHANIGESGTEVDSGARADQTEIYSDANSVNPDSMTIVKSSDSLERRCESSSEQSAKNTIKLGDKYYQITGKIGQGGMGVVYEVRSTDGIQLALKLIKKDINSEELKKRFQREGVIGASLEHPNLIKVHSNGITVDSYTFTPARGSIPIEIKEQTPYMLMEYVDGTDLKKWVKENLSSDNLSEHHVKQYHTEKFIDFVVQACNGLHYLHTREGKNLIHRDIKPENIFLQEGEELIAKVADFGLIHEDNNDDSLTDTGQAMGTPHYMSPEQFQGFKNIDATTDIYALGVMLYAAITGDLPFEEERERGRFAFQQAKLKRNPSRIDSERFGSLAEIIMKAISRNRALRYQTAKELGDDLQRYLNYEEVDTKYLTEEEFIKKTISECSLEGLKGLFDERYARGDIKKIKEIIEKSPFGNVVDDLMIGDYILENFRKEFSSVPRQIVTTDYKITKVMNNLCVENIGTVSKRKNELIKDRERLIDTLRENYEIVFRIGKEFNLNYSEKRVLDNARLLVARHYFMTRELDKAQEVLDQIIDRSLPELYAREAQINIIKSRDVTGKDREETIRLRREKYQNTLNKVKDYLENNFDANNLTVMTDMIHLTGVLYERLGDNKSSIRQFKEVLSMSEENTIKYNRARIALGNINCKIGEIHEAIEHYNMVFDGNVKMGPMPHDWLAYLAAGTNFAEALCETGKYDHSIKTAGKIMAIYQTVKRLDMPQNYGKVLKYDRDIATLLGVKIISKKKIGKDYVDDIVQVIEHGLANTKENRSDLTKELHREIKTIMISKKGKREQIYTRLSPEARGKFVGNAVSYAAATSSEYTFTGLMDFVFEKSGYEGLETAVKILDGKKIGEDTVKMYKERMAAYNHGKIRDIENRYGSERAKEIAQRLDVDYSLLPGRVQTD